MSTTAAELSNPLPTAKQAMEMLALRRLLWRRAGRHRSHAEMGLNKSAIEQSCSAALIGTSPRRQNAGRRGTA